MSTTTTTPANGVAPIAPNPYGDRETRPVQNAAAEAESQRAIAEVQAAMVVAQRFPRNERECVDRILNAFARVELCEKAMYEYARGGTDISGLSIRAAEAIFQQWGNVRFGVRELEQREGHSIVQAYAWDLQNNVQEERTFHVEHVRATKSRTYRLEDPRDIYELMANQGARRLRSCILALIPIDVQRAVEKQIELTLTNKIDLTTERVANLVDMFSKLGVTKRAIENLIQRNIESITPLQMVRLGRIFTAISDGVGSPGDYFEMEAPAEKPGEQPATRTDALAQRLGKKTENAAQEPPATNEGPPPSAEEQAQPTLGVSPEEQRKNDLRNRIAQAWKDVKPAQRTQIVSRNYGKLTLLDLNVAQLEELLEKLPEIIAAP